MISFNVRTELQISQADVTRVVGLAQFALDMQVIKDSNYYVPEDTQTLQNSAILSSNVGEGKIFWNTPYARKVYYNPQFNFSKDKNPNAQGLWFEAAKSAHRDDWIEIVKLGITNNL